MIEIFINSEFITLGQFLKFSGIISTGGEAKPYLNKNVIKINGNPDNRRGKKLFLNDIIEINEVKFVIKSKNND